MAKHKTGWLYHYVQAKEATGFVALFIQGITLRWWSIYYYRYIYMQEHKLYATLASHLCTLRA